MVSGIFDTFKLPSRLAPDVEGPGEKREAEYQEQEIEPTTMELHPAIRRRPSRRVIGGSRCGGDPDVRARPAHEPQSLPTSVVGHANVGASTFRARGCVHGNLTSCLG
jgi:hypothetical protein